MKIKELWIEDYHILKDFKLILDNQLTVFIGKNGSGKSTLIEFIAKIFFDIYEVYGVKRGFDGGKWEVSFRFDQSLPQMQSNFKILYEILYENITYDVQIDYMKEKEDYNFNINKKVIISDKNTGSHFNKGIVPEIREILPQKLVMYYSGIETILKDNFLNFQSNFLTQSVSSEIMVQQPFFYFLPHNFPMILIALLSFQYGDVPDTLEDKFGISGFIEIKIVLKKPNWGKGSVDTFWGAKGGIRTFLEKLKETCNNQKTENDTISITIDSKEELDNIRSLYVEEKKLFEYLVTLQANDLIKSIDITLIHKNKEISFNRLSEGEKQFLTIIGLRELLITGNTLFLLDEPDTYLHPGWQRDFVKQLVESEDSRINYFITTHSPQLLSALHEDNVRIMDNGKLFSLDSNGLFGRDSNSILEEVMDTFDMSPEAESQIEKFNEAIARNDLVEALDVIEKVKLHLSEKDPFFAVAEIRLTRLKRKLS